MTTDLPVSAADVEAAAARLQGIAHRTPVLRSRSADERCGAQLFFKAEHLQRMGAFKFRGAYNALAQLAPEQRRAGVVCFTSGNHGQAVALAGRLLGVPTVVVMPHDVPPPKLAAARGYQQGQAGSEVILFDRYREDRDAISARLVAERGLTLIPPFDHRDVIAGQGTAALELIDEVGPLDALVVCVGGGGLISGSALIGRARLPGLRVFGVEPAAGNDAQQSLARGEIVTIPVPQTIADGAQTPHIGRLTFPIMRALVERIVTVSDAQLVATMRFFAERMKQIVEPTGCLATAALLEGVLDLRGARVGVLISGGNVDMTRHASLLAAG